MNTKTFMMIFLILVAISVVLLSGCERTRRVVGSDPSSADAALTVKIGIIQPSGFATTFSKGAELARSQINAKGGVIGMPVEFIAMDNQGTRPLPDASETIRIAKALIHQEGVTAILGPIFSTNSTQVGPVVSELGYPLITGSSGSNVPATGAFVFIVVAPASIQGGAMAEFASTAAELSAKTAVTVHQNQDVHSMDATRAFEETFQKLGGKILASEVYEHEAKTFDGQLTRIKEASPDVIFLAGFNPEVPLLVSQARAMGIEATFLGSDGWDEPKKLFGTLADNAPLEGAYFTRNFSLESAASAPFVEAYTAMFMEPPNDQAGRGYDAMSLLAIAIETAETLEPTAIRDAFASITDYQGAVSISHYDENRYPVINLVLHTIRGGKIVLYDGEMATPE